MPLPSVAACRLGCLCLLAAALVRADEACCWCDKSTPQDVYTKKFKGEDFKMVFSDEFNEPGRKFGNGLDSKWTALDIGDTSNQGSAFYVPEQASIATDTKYKGVSALLITTVNESHVGDSPIGEKGIFMPFKSAMLQTWNKFCFTGGLVEFRARMPRGAGYWPALWLFGNLGRAVYQNSNTGLWPWSYSECDDDLELAPTSPPQRISACDDHDLETEGLHGFHGRGATELDVLEGAVTNDGKNSYVVGSLQLSPAVPSYFYPPMFAFPNAEGEGVWYSGLSFGPTGKPNNGWYGPPFGSPCPTGCPNALSGGITNHDDLDTKYWTYTMEWKLGPEGELGWYYDDEFIWGMGADSFGEYKHCADRPGGAQECSRTPKRHIPQEPMSLVMNTAIGTWNGGKSALDFKHFPARFYIDYVRVWQHEINIGCDPPNFPTRAYIDSNAELYGEPVSPVGYDTCPESYPPSAHKHAAQLRATATAKRAALAAAAAPAAAQQYRSTTQLLQSVDAAAAAPPTGGIGWPLLGTVGAVLALGVAAAALVTPERLRSWRSRALPSSADEDQAYQEYPLAE